MFPKQRSKFCIVRLCSDLSISFKKLKISLKSKMLSIGRGIKEGIKEELKELKISYINHLSIEIEDFHLKDGLVEPILFPEMLG